jgi:ribonuclease HI
MEYKAFVDGSHKNGITGYGVVILRNDMPILTISGVAQNTEMRQIAGELTAVAKVVEYCEIKGIKEIEINYDYTGCEYFVTGKWKTKKQFIMNYKLFINASDVNIKWNKVKSHSHNQFNDIADTLAKQACEVK